MTRAKGTNVPHTRHVPLRKAALARALLAAAVVALALVAGPATSAAGEYEAQIIGGTTVANGAWPGVVLIESDSGLCTGTLIAEEWVLTAAHCISDRADVYGGSTNIRSFTWRGAATGLAHPAYSADAFSHDVGLYRLDSPHPAALGEMDLVDPVTDGDLFGPGETLTAVGWGIDETGDISNDLRQATLDVYDAGQCEEVTEPGLFDRDTMLCLFHPDHFTCSGDSGGPIVSTRGGRRTVVGVTSFGNQGCDSISVAAGERQLLGWVRATALGEPFPTVRVAGVDRFSTAAEIAQAGWDGADTVYVTTGRNFPDALAAGPAAAAVGAPLLLVEQASVPASTTAELARLAPSEIVVLGGTAAVSDGVLAALGRAVPGATVRRVAGTDRYATAARAMADAFPAGTDHLYVVTGRSFQDALMAGAAAAFEGGALLLTDGQRPLEATVLDAVSDLAPIRITVVGAPGTITAAVATALGAVADVDFVADTDVHARSAALWDDVAPGMPVAVLATSASFADGLAGAAYAALPPASPLLLVPGTCVPSAVGAALERLAPGQVHLLGGTAAISSSVEDLAGC